MSLCNICDIPKKYLDPFLPIFTHFFMSSSGTKSKISKKGNSIICLNMVQQPTRLEVASGPFKHLGPGVQLRIWLWIAVNCSYITFLGSSELKAPYTNKSIKQIQILERTH